MDENIEVINNDSTTETEYTDVLNETSENTETVSTYSIAENETYTTVDRDTFDSCVADYSVDKELYIITLKQKGTTVLWEFVVPQKYCNDIHVIDGRIYNFGSETVRLAAPCYDASVNLTNPYYYILEIPVYGSEEYYRCLAEPYESGYMGTTPQPFNLYWVQSEDGSMTYTELSAYQPKFATVGSPMMSWSIDTIFLFIILILLIGRSVFRKG